MKRFATVEFITIDQEGEYGTWQVAKSIVTCAASGDTAEAYGESDASVRCALAKLTECCSCGANWHELQEVWR